MTHTDLQEIFNDKLKLIITDTDTPFITRDIEYYLNEAQNSYIDLYTKIFERSETARKALDQLVAESTLVIASPPGYTGMSTISIFYTIPTTVSKVVQERVNNDATIKVKPISHDYYLANYTNPFKSPYSKLVWRIDLADIHEIIPGPEMVISSYKIRYIKKHDPISFDTDGTCQLPDVDMYRIVDLAIKLAISSLGMETTKEES
jgi:hypothetical protein